MKKQYKVILPIIIVAGMLFGFKMANEPNPEKDKILIGLVRYALKQGHYEPQQIDDTFSENVFNDFIGALDPYKRFFLQSDIDELSVYKNLIDDQIKTLSQAGNDTDKMFASSGIEEIYDENKVQYVKNNLDNFIF